MKVVGVLFLFIAGAYVQGWPQQTNWHPPQNNNFGPQNNNFGPPNWGQQGGDQRGPNPHSHPAAGNNPAYQHGHTVPSNQEGHTHPEKFQPNMHVHPARGFNPYYQHEHEKPNEVHQQKPKPGNNWQFPQQNWKPNIPQQPKWPGQWPNTKPGTDNGHGTGQETGHGNEWPPKFPGNGWPPNKPPTGNGWPPKPPGNGWPKPPGNEWPPKPPGNGWPPKPPGNGWPPKPPGGGGPWNKPMHPLPPWMCKQDPNQAGCPPVKPEEPKPEPEECDSLPPNKCVVEYATEAGDTIFLDYPENNVVTFCVYATDKNKVVQFTLVESHASVPPGPTTACPDGLQISESGSSDDAAFTAKACGDLDTLSVKSSGRRLLVRFTGTGTSFGSDGMALVFEVKSVDKEATP